MRASPAADLFVDSFPYGAHTTANDALLVGVPLVTRAGETLVSRIAGSQLHAIGLPELVTPDSAAYEALALHARTKPAGAFRIPRPTRREPGDPSAVRHRALHARLRGRPGARLGRSSTRGSRRELADPIVDQINRVYYT